MRHCNRGARPLQGFGGRSSQVQGFEGAAAKVQRLGLSQPGFPCVYSARFLVNFDGFGHGVLFCLLVDTF